MHNHQIQHASRHEGAALPKNSRLPAFGKSIVAARQKGLAPRVPCCVTGLELGQDAPSGGNPGRHSR